MPREAGGGVIEDLPEDGPRPFEYDLGTPLGGEFPKAASVDFSRNFPKDRGLCDFQPTTHEVLIVSSRVVMLLKELDVPGLEYLPVAIRDHRKRVIANDYAILNPLGSQPAIDMARSSCVMNSILKDQIMRIKRLVLDRKAIDPTARLFRCSTFRRRFLIHEDLKEAIETANLTGYKLFDADNWDGKDYLGG